MAQRQMFTSCPHFQVREISLVFNMALFHMAIQDPRLCLVTEPSPRTVFLLYQETRMGTRMGRAHLSLKNPGPKSGKQTILYSQTIGQNLAMHYAYLQGC
jgi:hypothetical protein